MDDPWGSPWTSTDHDRGQDNDRPASSTSSKDGADGDAQADAPRPPHPAVLVGGLADSDAPFSGAGLSGNTPFASLPEPSPWADDNDDNAFGDWTTPSLGGGTSSGWGQPEGFAAAEGGGSSSSSQWLTPDPAKASIVGGGLGVLGGPGGFGGPGQLSPLAWPSAVLSPAGSPGASPGRRRTLSRASSAESKHSIPALRLDERAPSPAAAARVPSRSPVASSRPSTSYSDASSRAADDKGEAAGPHQDSSTTSIEDDAATVATPTNACAAAASRPHAVPRTSSSKVQGLVELYDGLSTRPASIRTLSVSPSRAASGQQEHIVVDSSVESAGSADGAENGREDGDEAAVVLLEPTLAEDKPEDKREDTLKSPTETEFTEAETTKAALPEVKAPDTTADIQTDEQAPDAAQTDSETPPPPDDLLSAARLLAIYGKTSYAIDQAKVDALLPPETTMKSNDSDWDAFIPDYILDDSFTSISERKAWYRIARHGSLRKHRGGGDDNENYRPVTWATSAIRTDTLQIVRRWMEEDSFTGKPTLGARFGSVRGFAAGGGVGGGGSGNVFGWDSAAEPVALDQVFKKKRRPAGHGGGHSKALSMKSVSSPPRAPMSSHVVESKENGVAARPAATRNSLSLPLEQPAVKQPSRFSVVLPSVNMAPMQPVAVKGASRVEENNDDDDDDWGEMVSSPTAAAQDTLMAASLPLPPPAPAVSVPAPTPAPAPTPVLDDRATAALADTIVRGLPDLSYMAV